MGSVLSLLCPSDQCVRINVGPSYFLSFTLVKECTQGVHELKGYLWNDDNVWIDEWMDEGMTFFRRWLRGKYLFYCLLPCHLAFLSSSLAPGLIKGVVDGPTSYIRVSYSGSAMTSYGILTSLNIFYSLQQNRNNKISSTELLTSLPVKCKMDPISITDDQEMIIPYFKNPCYLYSFLQWLQ